MLTLDRPQDAGLKEREVARSVRVRVRPDGPVVELPPGKTTVGSSPRCNIRIQQPGVQPLHCLILNESQGLTARRWSGETALNGQRLEESPLEPGDCLQVGPVELEIVSPQIATPSEQQASAMPVAQTANLPNTSRLQAGRELARSRNWKMLAALRERRDADVELRHRVAELERHLEQATRDRKEVAGQLQGVMSELAAARGQAIEHQGVVAQSEDLAAQNEQLDREVNTLIQRVDQLTSEQAASSAAQRALAEEKEKLAADGQRLSDENSQLRQQVEQNANRCTELSAERDAVSAQRESLQAEIHALTEKDAALFDDIRCLEHDLAQSRSQVTEFENRINAACSERDEARGQCDALRSELHPVSERETAHRANVERLEHELAHSRSQAVEFENRINSAYAERDEARGQCDALRSEVHATCEREAAQRSDAERLDHELAQLRLQAAELESRISAVSRERDEVRSQIETLHSEVHTLSHHAAAREEYIRQLEHENAGQEKYAAEQGKQIDQLRGDCDELCTQNEQIRTLCEQLRVQLSDLTQQHATLVESQAANDRERDELRERLQAAADEATKRDQERADLTTECEWLRQDVSRLSQLELQVRTAITDRETTSSELYRALLQLAEMQERDDQNVAIAAAHEALNAELQKSMQDIAELQLQIDRLNVQREVADEARQNIDQHAAELNETQRQLTDENASLAADLADAQAQLEAALRQEVELAERLHTAETWRERFEEAEQMRSELADTVSHLQEELTGTQQQAEETSTAALADRDRQLAEYTRLLAESAEAVRQLEQELTAARAANVHVGEARDDWRRELEDATQQQVQLSRRIVELESELAEAYEAASRTAAQQAVQASSPFQAILDHAAAEIVDSADGSPRERPADASDEFGAPQADPTGEFNWSTARGEAAGFGISASESDADPFSAGAEASGTGFSWGQPSASADSLTTTEAGHAFSSDGDGLPPSAPQVEDTQQSAVDWKSGAKAPAHLPEVASEQLSQPSVSQTAASLEVSQQEPSQSQSTSFIERYSHMFADDRLTNDAPTAAPTPARRAEEENAINPRRMGIVRSENGSQPPASVENEESIEDYMAKLLQRVRGDSSPTAIAPATPAPERPIPTMAQVCFNSGPLNVPVAVSNGEMTSPMAFDPSKRKASMPAPQTDLEALRALANESARRAISRHSLRRHRRNAITKVIVSTLAGVTSVWLMLNSESWLSLQFVMACITMLIAAYWAGETFRTLLESFRIAASDDLDGEVEELASEIRTTLPIDVENPRSWALQEKEAPVTASDSEPSPVA